MKSKLFVIRNIIIKDFSERAILNMIQSYQLRINDGIKITYVYFSRLRRKIMNKILTFYNRRVELFLI